MDAETVIKLSMLFVIAAVAAIALIFRAVRLSQFYVAGREIAPAANGAGIFASIVLPIALILGVQRGEGDALILGLAGVLGLLVSAAIFASSYHHHRKCRLNMLVHCSLPVGLVCCQARISR